MIEEILGKAGYEHYETSAFARPRRRCRHNLNYWEFGDYLGIGAGAHGKISYPDRITRHQRIKQPREYLAASGSTASEKAVPVSELPFEFMLNALRLVEGFPIALFEERTGQPLMILEKKLQKAEQAGLLERDWRRLRPTARGQRFLNELLELFLCDETPDRAPDVPAGARAIRIW
jgi:oxygen-independent coproporphyrinogen-3 oxidase